MVTCTETVGLTAGHIDVSLWYAIAESRERSFFVDKDEFYSARWFHVGDVPLSRSDPHLVRFLKKIGALD